MAFSKNDWLRTAKSHRKGNGKRSLTDWTIAMIEAADIPEESKAPALRIAILVLMNGGWRGDISDAWVKAGYTNSQFNFEMYQ